MHVLHLPIVFSSLLKELLYQKALFSSNYIYLFNSSCRTYYLTTQPNSVQTILLFQFLLQELLYAQHRSMCIFQLPLGGFPGSPSASTSMLRSSTFPCRRMKCKQLGLGEQQAQQLQGRAKGHPKGTSSPTPSGCCCCCRWHQPLEKRGCTSLGEPTKERGRWESSTLCSVSSEAGDRKGG